MDESTNEDLSAYLDEELGPEERARVASLLASSPEARVELDRLAAGRDMVRAAATRPTGAEVAALDAAVLGSLPPASVATNRGRPSPRKRGRPPWPYFAVAASIAVLLSLGIAVLAQVIGRDTSADSASASRSEVTAADSPPTAAADGPAPGAGAYPAQEQAPHTAAAPGLYLSGVEIGGAAELAAFAGGGPAATWGRDAGLADLIELGVGAGLDHTELEACLVAAGSGVPARVDVGSYAGTPAYLVVLEDPATSRRQAAAVARGTCTPLALVAADP